MRIILPAILAITQALHANQGPAESAADFAKKLAAGPVNLSPTTDTAIISEISATKKESILQRLQRLAEDIKGDEIQIISSRTEGSLAGVVLRMVDSAKPTDVRVVPLAMVQDDGVWRAAPVPASFENTSASYSRSSREMARQLEAWLAREQINEVERIRQAADSVLRESLAKSIAPETLRTWTVEQALSSFLEACEKRDATRILALMGGLSSPSPDGWAQAAAAVRAALSTPAPKADSWTLLTSPAVVRGRPVRADSGVDLPHEYTVLCIDPRNGRSSSLYQQKLIVSQTSDGLWDIRPASEPESVDRSAISQESATLFPAKFPLRAQASATELKNALLASFRAKSSPYDCLHLLHRDNVPESDFPRFSDAVDMCWQTISPAMIVMPRELGFLEDADHAYLAVNWLSLTRLTYAAKVIHFQKTPKGWVWNSTPDNAQTVASETWMKLNEAAWKKDSLAIAVQDCAKPDLALPRPAVAEAAKVVGEWISALAESDWEKALSQCAQLGTAKSPTELLRNLGHESKTSRLASSKPTHECIAEGKTVTLFGTRSAEKGNPLVTLLPVVATAQGPRILLEIDLGDPARPGRSFLNRNSLERLKAVHPEMAEDLKNLLSQLPAAK